MIRSVKPQFKLAAMDLDGTLLGPDGQISAANSAAVRRLQRDGVQVVLASGRHYRNMRQYAEALPGVRWLVSCQGGEAADISRSTILGRSFLPAAKARPVLKLARSFGFSTAAYAVEEVLTDSDWNARLEFYTNLAGRQPRQLPSLEAWEQPIFKIIWMGEPAEIEVASKQIGRLDLGVQVVRTHARLLEFMPVGVSKATALKLIASRLGVQPSEAVVFGDGDNDVPMFEWAGVSVAMPHGWPGALRKATHLAPAGPPGTALARIKAMLLSAWESTRP